MAFHPHHFYFIRLPSEWKTPVGYSIVLSIEFTGAYYINHIAACYISTLIASCYIIFNFCDDIKNEIHAFDNGIKFGENNVELMKRVSDFVEFHAAVKQLSDDTNFESTTVIIFLLIAPISIL